MGRSKFALVTLVSVLCLAVAVTGCAAAQPEVTIITPVNGAEVQTGQNVAVRISATSRRGLTGIQLWVDGELYHTDRDAGGQRLYTIGISWRPETPGEHILTARSVDTRGRSSDPVRAVVNAVGAGVAPQPSGGAQPAAPGAPVIDYFYSEPVSERPGCYYLHWDFSGATSALLNGQGITAPGSTEVCPDTTTVYRLEATNDSGTTAQEIVIEIGGAPASGGAPPAGGGEPPAGGGEPPAGGGEPPAGGGEPPAGGGELPVIDYFTSEPSERGGCYYLHWDLHGASAAYLNGQGVAAPGSTEECPTETTVYRLEATNDAGTVAEEIVIEVSGGPPEGPPGHPDLVITELTIRPESPRQGEQAIVHVSYANQGDADSPPFTVQWWATPALVGCTWEIDGLAANAWGGAECPYIYQSWSTYTTHAIVDEDNSIPESDDDNNTRELVVPVQQGGGGGGEQPGQPDLVITELTIRPESPRQGEQAIVHVSYANQGDADSPPFSLQWWATPALVGCTWEIDGLAANAWGGAECPYIYQSWSTYTTHAIVDDDNSVPESDDDNNTRELVVPVQQQ